MKIDLKQIEISEHHPLPRWEKVAKCYHHYIKTGDLGKPIILNQYDILVDNYTVYLVAKMFDIKEVEVEYIERI